MVHGIVVSGGVYSNMSGLMYLDPTSQVRHQVPGGCWYGLIFSTETRSLGTLFLDSDLTEQQKQ